MLVLMREELRYYEEGEVPGEVPNDTPFICLRKID
jgi:hypothetical protein